MADKVQKRTGAILEMDMKRPPVKAGYVVVVIVMTIVSLICVFPPLWVILSSFKDLKEFFRIPPTLIPRTFHPEKLLEVWKATGFGRIYWNTTLVAVGSVLAAIFFNGLLGYVLSRLKPIGSRLIFTLIVWTMMLPNTVGMVPLYKNMIDWGMTNSYIPLWLMRGANAYFVIVFKSFFDGIPKEFIEAARIDGSSDLGIFFRIIMPLSKAVMIVVMLFTINAVWSDFLWPYLLINDMNMYTVIIRLYRMQTGFSADKQLIAMTFAIVPPVVLFAIFQKHIMTGFSLGGIKG